MNIPAKEAVIFMYNQCVRYLSRRTVCRADKHGRTSPHI